MSETQHIRERDKHLLYLQVVVTLFLLAGLILVAVRLFTGRWAPIVGVQYSEPASAFVSAACIGYGVLGWRLAHAVKRGSESAAMWLVGVTSLFLVLSVVELLAVGRGWYEAILCLFLVGDSAVVLNRTRDIADSQRHAQIQD